MASTTTDLLSISDIETEFGFPVNRFRRLQQRGWKVLDGGRLTPTKLPTGHGGLTENRYPRPKVAAAIAAYQGRADDPTGRGWLTEWIFLDDKKRRWRTSRGVTKMKLPRKSIGRWSEKNGPGCRYLDGRPIQTQMVTPFAPCAVQRVKVYLETDLQEVLDATKEKPRRTPGTAPLLRDKHGDWLTTGQMQAHFLEQRISRHFCLYWSRRRSRNDPTRKALRSQRVNNPTRYKRGSPSQVRVFLLADAEAILRAEEHRFPGCGRQPGRWDRTAADQQAVKVLKSLLADGPVPSVRIASLAHARGVRSGRLQRAMKLAKIRPKKTTAGWFWCLPGQDLSDAGLAGTSKPERATAAIPVVVPSPQLDGAEGIIFNNRLIVRGVPVKLTSDLRDFGALLFRSRGAMVSTLTTAACQSSEPAFHRRLTAFRQRLSKELAEAGAPFKIEFRTHRDDGLTWTYFQLPTGS